MTAIVRSMARGDQAILTFAELQGCGPWPWNGRRPGHVRAVSPQSGYRGGSRPRPEAARTWKHREEPRRYGRAGSGRRGAWFFVLARRSWPRWRGTPRGAGHLRQGGFATSVPPPAYIIAYLRMYNHHPEVRYNVRRGRYRCREAALTKIDRKSTRLNSSHV